MFGDHPDDYTDTHFIPLAIWPALQVFLSISNQWRSDMNGPYALDYNVVPFAMDMIEIPPEDRVEVYQDVRTMERAALDAMRNNTPKPAD